MQDSTSDDQVVQDTSHDPQTETLSQSAPERVHRQLRIWPAVVLLIVLWSLRIIPGFFETMSMPVMMARFMGPLVCCGLIIVWWLFLSRARWGEKLLVLLGLTAIIVVTTMLADKTIQGFGTMIDVLPWGMSAFVVALTFFSRAPTAQRVGFSLAAALIVFAYWDLVRTDEIRGDFQSSRSWRWQPTAEDRFLEDLAARTPANPELTEISNTLGEVKWSEFRGPRRDGVQPGIVLGEDWNAHPPEQLWRIDVGPGWSSFAIAGNRLFTQEQRGEHEVVVCYQAGSGAELWTHEYISRFWEVIGGAGPRATPTLHDGNLYALGAAGILHRLDPITGEPQWQRDISTDADREPPQWGFSSSPLVTDGVVIVHAGGKKEKGILAYDVESGDLRWSAPAGGHSYSSPQLCESSDRRCVLMLTDAGLTIVDPVNGELLGEHPWEYEGYRVIQPLVIGGSSVLLGTAMGTGTRRIELRLHGEQFVSDVAWTSLRISPYYNDFVAHNEYLYGFDNNIFTCIDLSTGDRKWKRGRYGNGQVLLLPDADQLLVTSEDGELVLLRATPDEHLELGRHQVLEGRTWNHPVLIGHRLYVRNGEEAACFQLPASGVDALR